MFSCLVASITSTKFEMHSTICQDEVTNGWLRHWSLQASLDQ